MHVPSCLHTVLREKIFCGKKPLHVGMEVQKAQRQGRDYTTQKKTNLIQVQYPTSVPHT